MHNTCLAHTFANFHTNGLNGNSNTSNTNEFRQQQQKKALFVVVVCCLQLNYFASWMNAYTHERVRERESGKKQDGRRLIFIWRDFRYVTQWKMHCFNNKNSMSVSSQCLANLTIIPVKWFGFCRSKKNYITRYSHQLSKRRMYEENVWIPTKQNDNFHSIEEEK